MSDIFSLVSLLLSVCTIFYTSLRERQSADSDSYLDVLNYDIEVVPAETAIINNIQGSTGKEIDTNRIEVSSSLGGIQSVRLVYLKDGEYLFTTPLKPGSEVDREKYSATDFTCWVTDFTQYGYHYGESSNRVESSGKSYYSYVFLVIEDYLNNRYTNALVFEYPLGKDGDVFKPDFRLYEELDLLYLKGQSSPLPAVDRIALQEYQKLIEDLNSL